jgi:AraC-like DNA-binding protein
MSYDPALLFQRISSNLYGNPSLSLAELSQELRVSRRTIQNTVIVTSGKKFRELRDELLLAKFQCALVTEPSFTIKELSSEIGYGSPRSFARAIRRASGVSPEQLRARLAGELIGVESMNIH